MGQRGRTTWEGVAQKRNSDRGGGGNWAANPKKDMVLGTLTPAQRGLTTGQVSQRNWLNKTSKCEEIAVVF